MTFRTLALAVIFSLSCPTYSANAQDGAQRLGTVTVTSSRQNGYVTADTRPSITRNVRADYLYQQFTIQSGTADVEERRVEMKSTFDRMLARFADMEGMTLYATQNNNPIPIETVTFDDLYDAAGRGNFSYLQYILRLDVGEDDSFTQVRDRANGFIEGIRARGRVEITINENQLLGVDNLPVHRLELLRDIAADVAAIREMFAEDDIRVTGLHSPVVTVPEGPLMMQIYIPYQLVLGAEN